MIATDVKKENERSSTPATRYSISITLLGALTMLPPLSTDVSLPALPVIAHALHAPGGLVQWTLSVFIFAFGLGQLVLGPLSDRYGRRPVLFGGLALFSIVGLACALTHNVQALIALRFLQGLSACAGTVCAIAIVHDIAENRERAASLQAYVNAVNSVAPIVAPLIGAAVLALLGWRWIYGVLAIAGVAMIAGVVWGVPETSPCLASNTMDAYRRVLKLPRTVALAALVACSFGAYFALISSSPFVLVAQFHLPNSLFAAAFAVNAISALAGSLLAGRLVPRLGAERIFAYGIGLELVAGFLVWGFDWFKPSPVAFVITMALFAFGFGIIFPGAFAAALADAGNDAGLASGILGASQMLGGGVGSAIAGILPWNASASVGLVTLIGAIGVGVGYWFSRVDASPEAIRDVS